jgi:hypothetical protein
LFHHFRGCISHNETKIIYNLLSIVWCIKNLPHCKSSKCPVFLDIEHVSFLVLFFFLRFVILRYKHFGNQQQFTYIVSGFMSQVVLRKGKMFFCWGLCFFMSFGLTMWLILRAHYSLEEKSKVTWLSGSNFFFICS